MVKAAAIHILLQLLQRRIHILLQIWPRLRPLLTASKAVQERASLCLKKDAPEVVTTPTSQYVENESSGDAHPVAGETSIEPKLEECIEEIIEIAQADNGALLEGDLPQRTRYEATEISMVAQDLLATLYSCMGGVALRSEREVFQAMSTPIQRRQEYLNTITASRDISEKDAPEVMTTPTS